MIGKKYAISGRILCKTETLGKINNCYREDKYMGKKIGGGEIIARAEGMKWS